MKIVITQQEAIDAWRRENKLSEETNIEISGVMAVGSAVIKNYQPTLGCTCLLAWNGITPAPTCPIHGSIRSITTRGSGSEYNKIIPGSEHNI